MSTSHLSMIYPCDTDAEAMPWNRVTHQKADEYKKRHWSVTEDMYMYITYGVPLHMCIYSKTIHNLFINLCRVSGGMLNFLA